jgi:hypothetical protein
MDAVDKFWKGRINPVGDEAILDFCAVLCPMFFGSIR